MEEDQATRLEGMEKAQQELQDKFAQMMDMMVRMANGKAVPKNHGSQEGHAYQDSRENPQYPPKFTPHHAQTSQEHTYQKCHGWVGILIPKYLSQ